MGKFNYIQGYVNAQLCWYGTLTAVRSITLTRNSQFYVRHGDVERLIQQGYLQRLS
jgi:hypothetical protein